MKQARKQESRPQDERAKRAKREGRLCQYNVKTLLLLRQFSHILQSLKTATAADEEWVKANEKDRPIHISVMQDKQACPVCFKSKYVKLFAMSGLQQHFRTMHRERFSDDIIKQAKQLTEKLHGDKGQRPFPPLSHKTANGRFFFNPHPPPPPQNGHSKVGKFSNILKAQFLK